MISIGSLAYVFSHDGAPLWVYPDTGTNNDQDELVTDLFQGDIVMIVGHASFRYYFCVTRAGVGYIGVRRLKQL